VVPTRILITSFVVRCRQRRREDDFLRTVANYRTTVATLKQEKEALLDIQQGGEGEKFDLIATSQNALARAAQLVSDAAETRRREAKAALDGIERSLFKSLSERIDSLVPHSHVSAELSAITGELQASKALSVASKTLHGITSSFAKAIRPALPESEGTDNASASGSMHLSDELRQKVTNIFYQAEFAQVIADTASELIRLLVAGQWPGLLSQTESIELGSRLSHPASSIDATLGAVLKCLIEEGSLTPEQSNLEAVRRTLNSNVQSMHSDLRQDNDRELVSMNWKPPALDMMKEASFAKFSSLAMAAALSTVVSEGDQSRSSDVSRIYSKIEQLSSQAIAVCQRLSAVEVTDEALVAKLSALVLKWAEGSAQLASSVRDALLGNRDWKTCEELSETNLRDLALLSSTLRASKLSPSDEGVLHPFSPESDDGWSGITAIACRVRSLDGDGDDVNYLVRARVVERRLSNAVDNESKLETATSRIASLEKVSARCDSI
jgi:dynactin 1